MDDTKYQEQSIFDEVDWGYFFNRVRLGKKWGLQNAKTGILDLPCVHEDIKRLPRSQTKFITVLRRNETKYIPNPQHTERVNERT